MDEEFFCEVCNHNVGGAKQTHDRRVHQSQVKIELSAIGAIFPNGSSSMDVTRVNGVCVLSVFLQRLLPCPERLFPHRPLPAPLGAWGCFLRSQEVFKGT